MSNEPASYSPGAVRESDVAQSQMCYLVTCKKIPSVKVVQQICMVDIGAMTLDIIVTFVEWAIFGFPAVSSAHPGQNILCCAQCFGRRSNDILCYDAQEKNSCLSPAGSGCSGLILLSNHQADQPLFSCHRLYLFHGWSTYLFVF